LRELGFGSWELTRFVTTLPSLTNKVAIVTGSTSGIGRGIAEHFATLGACVVIHGPEPDPARAIAERLRSAGHDALSVHGDVRDVEACRRVVRSAIEARGGVDILVNNAGDTSRGRLEDASLEFWDNMMAVNLRAPFLCLQEAVKSMKTRGGGSIVNIGSINAYVGSPKLGPYAVSKGGLMTLTRNAACALNVYGIRVNQLNVGWTMTEGEDVVQRKQRDGRDWLDQALATRPFGRLLTPQDIAYAAAYFASDESALITGAVLDMEQIPPGAYVDF
jgi:NAD(P)-dependent dehydrogenase (short-subunit alcohol dehydrogenase family)